MSRRVTQAIFIGSALLAHLALAQDSPVRVLGIMKAVVSPASDVVFSVGKAQPKSEREWAEVENAAAKLIDADKTLATEAPAANGANWTRLSGAMAHAAAVARKAARERNVDAVLDAGDVLFTTCEDCHREYIKKN